MVALHTSRCIEQGRIKWVAPQGAQQAAAPAQRRPQRRRGRPVTPGGGLEAEPSLASDSLSADEQAELEKQFSVSEAPSLKHSGSILEMVASEYAPVAAGVPWVRLDEARTVLPLPLQEAAQMDKKTTSTRACDWHCWSGTGSILGIKQRTFLLAPLPRVPGQAAPQSPPQPEVSSLPVALTINAFDGLFQNPLLQEVRASPITIGQFLLQLYLLRLRPAGPVQGTGLPQNITNSWHATDAGTVLGIEFELPATHVEDWALHLPPPSTKLAHIPSRKIGMTLRHNVTFILDAAKDCVHEVSLVAPASVWDTLWEPQQERAAESAAAVDAGELLAHHLGLTDTFRFRAVLDYVTIVPSSRAQQGSDADEAEGRDS
jgi:hypothetical protein